MIDSTRIRIALAWGGALIVLSGCAVSGTPVAGEPDVRGLETGTFATDRHSYTDTAGDRGALVEGARMSAAVVPAVRIDPSLSHGRGGVVVPDIERALDFVANVSKPVLENRKFVTGYVALGADRADPDGQTRPGPDATDLTAWVDKNLAAELAQLAKFDPTPTEKISDLPVDPAGLLARAVVDDRSTMRPGQFSFASYAPQHLVNKAADLTARQNLVDATGVDAHAVVEGGAVTRVRDQSAAQSLMRGLIDSAGHYDPITAPADVPTATCLKLNDNGNKEDDYVYRCYVAYKRYLAMVSADGEPEVRQKITAQYALLANSL